jgi:hypothetical protein
MLISTWQVNEKNERFWHNFGSVTWLVPLEVDAELNRRDISANLIPLTG